MQVSPRGRVDPIQDNSRPKQNALLSVCSSCTCRQEVGWTPIQDNSRPKQNALLSVCSSCKCCQEVRCALIQENSQPKQNALLSVCSSCKCCQEVAWTPTQGPALTLQPPGFPLQIPEGHPPRQVCGLFLGLAKTIHSHVYVCCAYCTCSVVEKSYTQSCMVYM